MIRLAAYVLILSALIFAPVNKLDVAKLEPVEIVYIAQEGSLIKVSTDTGAAGDGETIEQALHMLNATTAGVIYLDTAEYLLFNSKIESQIKQLEGSLRANVRICLAESADLENLAQFLESHGEFPYLRSWNTGDPLPELKDGKIVQKQ